MTRPLTAKSSVGDWLTHPVGGPLVRGYLEEAGVDERLLAPVRMLSLERAAGMTGGRVTPEMIEGLVAAANRA